MLKQQPELFFAVLPLALVGAGVGTRSDYKHASEMLSRPLELTLVLGDTAKASEIADIAKSGDLNGAEAMLREAMQSSGKDTEAIQKVRSDAQKSLKAEAELLREAFKRGEDLGIIPVYTPVKDGHKIIFNDGTERVFETYTEANEARMKFAGLENFRFHSDIATTISHVDRTQREGQGARYIFGQRTDTLREAKESGLSSGEYAMERADEAAADGQVTEATVLTDEEIQASIDTEYEAGTTAAEIKALSEEDRLSAFTIIGSNRTFKDGIYITNVRLEAGATWATVIEEKMEGDAFVHMKEGRREWLKKSLRQFERLANEPIFRPGIADDAITDNDIKGAYARAGVAYFIGTADEQGGFQRSAKFKKRYDALVKAGLGGSMEGYARFFLAVALRADALNKLRREGKLDADLERELARSVGFSEQFEYEQKAIEEGQKFKQEIDPDGVLNETAAEFDSAAEAAFENSTDASFSVIHNATGYSGDTGNLGDYNAFLRSRSLLDLNEFRVNPRSNILFRPDRLYRVVNSEGYQDFLDSGLVRPNQVGLRGHTYSHLYAAVGATGARYKGAFVIEMVPEAGQWEFVGAGYARNAAAKIDATGPVRVFRAIEDGSFEVVHDNIGDAAFLEENGALNDPPMKVVEEGEGYSKTAMPDGMTLEGPATFSVIAFHGTPHKIPINEGFRMDKVGTGEGAQVYGHGLYFSESRAVGEGYARNLITKVPIQFDGQEYNPDDPRHRAGMRLRVSNGDRSAALAKLEQVDEGAARALRERDEAKIREIGNLYTVELLPDADEFLDWDKPLGQQSEKVREAFIKAMEQSPKELPAGFDINRLEGPGFLVAVGKIDDRHDDRVASERLLSLGIPGIRYLDGNSRADGTGTHNYVIFDEKLVRILEENGQTARQGETSFSVISKTSLRMKMTRESIIGAIENSADWKDFYSRHKELLANYFGSDADLFQRILSATSQAASVKANVSLALKAYGQLRNGEEFSGYLPAVIGNLEKIRQDSGKLGGRKIGNYDAATAGDTSKVVVDRHVARMLFGTISPTKAQFEKAEKVLTEIAQRIGWTPSEVQAAIWAASIRKAGLEPESYDRYLKRLNDEGTLEQKLGGKLPRDGGSLVSGASGRFDSSGGTQNAGGRSGADPSFSVISSKFLRDDPRFEALKQDGRIETGVDVEKFTGMHAMLHSPDMAFSGDLSFGDETIISGKGGAYYPLLFADDNYFWASTENTAKDTAKNLNLISKKNGGKAVMALLSAPVEKMFSSTTMSTGVIDFFYRMSKSPRRSGINRSNLNAILVKASRVVSSKGKSFNLNLSSKGSLEDNINALREALQPTASSFDLRKTFVESVASQVAGAVKSIDQAQYLSGILLSDDNRFAKSAIRKGKLSKASIMQALGHHLTEPFLRDFQEYANGAIYSIIEVDGEVEAVRSDRHESYPFAIVPKNKDAKVKVSVLEKAYDWQSIVGRDSGEYSSAEERLNLMPTGGMSVTSLKFLGPRESDSPVRSGLSFSVITNAESRIAESFNPFLRNPEKRLKIVLEAQRRAAEKARGFQEIIRLNRSGADIERERLTREADLMGEKLDTLSPSEIGALEAMGTLDDIGMRPILSDLLREKYYKTKSGKSVKYWRGSLMSKSAAERQGIDTKGGEWDGIPEGLPPYVWGGSVMPDQAASQFGFETTDEFWTALSAEVASYQNLKADTKAAMTRIRDLEKEAKAESKAWADEQKRLRKTVGTDRATLIAAMRTLDAMISALPSEIRGKIGGMVRLAQFKGPGAMLDELERRANRLDVELERWLKKEATKEAKDFFATVKKKVKTDAGKKAQADALPEMVVVMKAAEEAFKSMSAEQGQARGAEISGLLLSGKVPDNDVAAMQMMAELIPLFSGWNGRTEQQVINGKDARVRVAEASSTAQKFSAIEAAKKYWTEGMLEYKRQAAETKERRDQMREGGMEDVAKANKLLTRDEQRGIEQTRKSLPKKFALNIMTFDGFFRWHLGDDSKLYQWLTDSERKAANTYDDAVRNITKAVDSWFTEKAGSRFKGEKLRERMAESKTKITPEVGEVRTMSQLEMITAKLIWRQEDGKRHMKGRRDENGNVVSTWSYGEDFMAQIDEAISNEALELMDFLSDAYDAEYEPLNKVYRKLFGIDLPKHLLYSPLTVKPMIKGDAGVDSITGFFSGGLSGIAGALKTRGSSIVEPDFKDALQTYVSHSMQMEHFKAFAELSREARAILGRVEFRDQIQRASGEEGVAVLDGLLEILDKGGIRSSHVYLEATRTLDKLTGRLSTMILFGKLQTVALNVTQLAAASSEMGVATYWKQFGKLWFTPTNWADALRTPYIQRRIDEMPPVVRQVLESNRKLAPSRLSDINDKLGYGISASDGFFTAASYAMVYDWKQEQGRKMEMDGDFLETWARNETERIMDRIAQPTRKGARSIFENTLGPEGRAFFNFFSDSRKNVALASYAAQKDRSKLAGVAQFVFLNAAISSVIRAAWADLRDDDEEMDELYWNPGKIALEIAIDPLYGIPVVGGMLQDAIKSAFGFKVFGGSIFESGQSAIPATRRLLALDYDADEIDRIAADVNAILGAFGYFSREAAALTSITNVIEDALKVYDNLTQ
jgi:hypothetical protein